MDVTHAPWETRQDEVLGIEIPSRKRGAGSRIAGRVQVPHPAAPEVPVIAISEDALLPAEFTRTGPVPGLEWLEDESIGWWAEAAAPDHCAARLADYLAAGRGEAKLVVTDRRIAVILPEPVLTAATAPPKEKKGLLGRLFTLPEQIPDDCRWVILWETDSGRLTSHHTAMAGRSFPFARLARLTFADGSILLGRRSFQDTWPTHPA
ncbi:hypothetical protein [Actinokineospora enzanensis]|uniref:hypothetical protein n=1 Tax=Actinokineospora enzanensis TaxID=155975 RepID=UPI00035E8DC4|nr:hypothetical protein [Actinokineospora enzanensis]